ncbi:unnamed protein product [Camellia sinensis]
MHCDAIEDEIKLLQGKAKLHIKATNDGTVHAVASWWVLQLDCEGTIFYSTGPKWISFPFNKELQSSFPSELDILNHLKKQVELLVGEPFYYGNDSMLPWQNLWLWKERTMLDPVLSNDALIMPCKGILKACAMSLPDLWRSRRCLTQIEGFDHSVVNVTLGACGDLPASQESPCFPFFVWQCGENKGLSEISIVMEFDFSEPISPCFGKAQNKRYWKQGIKLLAKPVTVGIHGLSRGNTSAEIEASFNPSNGGIDIKYAFS